MASADSGCVLLRRPLPPLKKKPTTYRVDFAKSVDKGITKENNNNRSIEVYNSLERETTRQKTNDEIQIAKMKEYHRRLELLFTYGKPRGGDPFPCRPPKKSAEIDFTAFIEDSYKPPSPEFTLGDFLKDSKTQNFGYLKANTNGHCTDIVPFVEKSSAERTLHIYPNSKSRKSDAAQDSTKCQSILLDKNVILPDIAERKPLHQQFIEDKAFLLEQFTKEFNKDTGAAKMNKSIVWPSILAPTFVTKDGQKISFENAIYEQEYEDIPEDVDGKQHSTEQHSTEQYSTEYHSAESPSKMSFRKVDPRSIEREVTGSKSARSTDNDFANDGIILANASPTYFQGELAARSPSPFEFNDLQSVFPAELAVLECTAHGATKLNLKAHFLETLPDLSQLTSTLTHINLSFNDLMQFPNELFQVTQLETLKMRNNPIQEIPKEIKKLKKLKNLVLSFCCISSLSPGLFKLVKLEKLDLSYNQISFLPDNVNRLRNLQAMNLEGNQLTAFPRSVLQLSLRFLNIANNFTNPLFWKSTAPPQPQQLLESCANFLARTGHHLDVGSDEVKLNAYFKTILTCDFCGGAKFGQGIRVVKPAAELFGVKNVPILFNVCSQTCRKALRTSAELSLSPDIAD
eukprot:gene8815-9760_t